MPVPAPDGHHQEREEQGIGAARREGADEDRGHEHQRRQPPQAHRQQHEEEYARGQPGDQIRPVGELVVEAEEHGRGLEQEGEGRVGDLGDVAAVGEIGPVVRRRVEQARR
jgi:hypothetical protein